MNRKRISLLLALTTPLIYFISSANAMNYKEQRDTAIIAFSCFSKNLEKARKDGINGDDYSIFSFNSCSCLAKEIYPYLNDPSAMRTHMMDAVDQCLYPSILKATSAMFNAKKANSPNDIEKTCIAVFAKAVTSNKSYPPQERADFCKCASPEMAKTLKTLSKLSTEDADETIDEIVTECNSDDENEGEEASD
jgi:hypothetical protein